MEKEKKINKFMTRVNSEIYNLNALELQPMCINKSGPRQATSEIASIMNGSSAMCFFAHPIGQI